MILDVPSFESITVPFRSLSSLVVHPWPIETSHEEKYNDETVAMDWLSIFANPTPSTLYLYL